MMNRQPEIKLRIGGMTCVHCGAHVVTALENVPGVERAEIPDWKSGQAIVFTNEGVVPDRLLTAITEAGYTAAVQK